MNKPVYLGQINFTNCLPVNYCFQKWAIEGIILKNGHPALINSLMQEGKLHVAPVSSLEYLLNKDKYTLIDNLCISSDGEAGSVILFSNYEFSELSGKKIGVPHTSYTSIALLRILLEKYEVKNAQFINHQYETSLHEALKDKYDAVLYIGDPALVANIKDTGKKYDLGKLWKEITGYPMVFGTWAALSAWKESNEDDFSQINLLLTKAVANGLGIYFNEIINLASSGLNLDKAHIRHYLTKNIRYEFSEKHRESLDLFKTLHTRKSK